LVALGSNWRREARNCVTWAAKVNINRACAPPIGKTLFADPL